MIEYIVNVGASMASSERSLKLAEKYPFIYAAVGVHPDEVGELDEEKFIKDVSSYAFTSSYPYVMVTHKFPMSLFLKCNLKKFEQMLKNFAYLIHINFKNIKCKYFNNFISQNKCTKITGRQI